MAQLCEPAVGEAELVESLVVEPPLPVLLEAVELLVAESVDVEPLLPVVLEAVELPALVAESVELAPPVPDRGEPEPVEPVVSLVAVACVVSVLLLLPTDTVSLALSLAPAEVPPSAPPALEPSVSELSVPTASAEPAAVTLGCTSSSTS